MPMDAAAAEGCSGNHSGGKGQVRGIYGITTLGPATMIAIMSSTETAMAPAANQPSACLGRCGSVARSGSPVGGAIGGPVVLVVKLGHSALSAISPAPARGARPQPNS